MFRCCCTLRRRSEKLLSLRRRRRSIRAQFHADPANRSTNPNPERKRNAVFQKLTRNCNRCNFMVTSVYQPTRQKFLSGGQGKASGTLVVLGWTVVNLINNGIKTMYHGYFRSECHISHNQKFLIRLDSNPWPQRVSSQRSWLRDYKNTTRQWLGKTGWRQSAVKIKLLIPIEHTGSKGQ